MARGDGASTPNPMRELTGSDGMDWRTFLAIQVAASEALRRNVKLENCRIRALDWSEARFRRHLSRENFMTHVAVPARDRSEQNSREGRKEKKQDVQGSAAHQGKRRARHR